MNSFPSKADRVEKLRALIRGGGAACAPMAGITDRPFRRICRRMGSIYVTSELLSSEGWRRGSEKTEKMAVFDEEERPIGIQLFGADPESMAAAARHAEVLEPDFIDINFGCPVKKIVRSGGGSACMKDLPLMEEIVRAVNEATALPVTMKIRAGWDAEHLNAPEATAIGESAGLAFVTVHGRVRTQFYTGEASLEVIRDCKAAVGIPVVGNGDVTDAAGYRRMMEVTGVDAVLVGRGCIGNPWIFREIEAFRRDEAWSPPAAGQRLDMVLEHMGAKVVEHGEGRGVIEFRKQFAYYLKGLPGAAALRRQIFTVETLGEVREILESYRKEMGY